MESGAGGERIGSGGQELTVSYDDVLYIVIRSAHRIYPSLTMRDYDDAYSYSLHKSCHFARHGVALDSIIFWNIDGVKAETCVIYPRLE